MIVLAIVCLICCAAVTAKMVDKQRNGYLSHRKKRLYTVLIIALAIAAVFFFLVTYVNSDYGYLYGTILSPFFHA